MSETLERIRALVAGREVRVSDHGYDELAADGILVREVVAGVDKALVLKNSPAVLVTAYRPDPERWTEDFQRRRDT